jgi:hypothetical protein
MVYIVYAYICKYSTGNKTQVGRIPTKFNIVSTLEKGRVRFAIAVLQNCFLNKGTLSKQHDMGRLGLWYYPLNFLCLKYIKN